MNTTLVLGILVALPQAPVPVRPERAEPGTLKVELSGTATALTVTFTNKGTTPIRILKPLDGSEWCWIMPHYRLTMTDGMGQALRFSPRCKLHGMPYNNTRWPEDYLVTIAPGKSHVHGLSLNHVWAQEGTYTAQFRYTFRPTTDETPGGKYPDKLWTGEAVSNRIERTLPKPK